MDEVEQRVVRARMQLRERWRAKMLATRALADPKPQGSGPPNRHGMPQLPPGQKKTTKWPVLDLGRQPSIPLSDWSLSLDGCCLNPLKLSWEDFQALDRVEDVSDFHCVTGWSKLDMVWRGVRLADLADLAALAQVSESATHVICHAYDGYTTNLPLEEALKSDVLLVDTADGQLLSREHGGPVRMITPQLYAWKGAKWISRLEFVESDQLGYWERNGYSNTAHPWQDDRYSVGDNSGRMPGWGIYLKPMLRWLAAVLIISCLLLLWATLQHRADLALTIQVASCLAAFGSVPYAVFCPERRD